MERSIRNLTDPIIGLPNGERRRGIRQKLNTPVYASFNGPQSGMVVDLSELLDLHEDGFSVQTSQRLEVSRPITVCLDLPETQNYIHCTGQVVWSDDTGRGGIQFSGLPDRSRQILKEWLFANLMIGCSNHEARTEQMVRRKQEDENPESSPVTAAVALSAAAASVAKTPSIVPISEGSARLAAVDAVRLVVRELGDDLDAILQLITERALSFTGANGAALALMTGGQMICRARAGETAPPLGAAVDVTQGLSGECIRGGLLVTCVDTENDARVDPEVCRDLGIGSLMAAPITPGLQVEGLLEVFSDHSHSFTKAHEVVLERLVELIPRTSSEKTKLESGSEELRHESSVRPEVAPSVAPIGSTRTPHADAMEFASIHASHEVFSEPEPASHEQTLRADTARAVTANEEIGAEKNPAQDSEADSKSAARLLYRALLGLAIIVVFVAVGYLVAPMVDKRWVISPQASQRPLNEAASVQRDRSPQTAFLADLQKLANQGNADAQWELGARYHNGEGVPRDDAQAMQWFERAAEQGHVTAQATLGAYYWAGRGVPSDLTKAYFWSTLALAQGDENSKARIEGLATQMTREQVSAARQQAEVWLRSHNERAKSAAN